MKGALRPNPSANSVSVGRSCVHFVTGMYSGKPKGTRDEHMSGGKQMSRQPELPEFFRDLEIERTFRLESLELGANQQEKERDDASQN